MQKQRCSRNLIAHAGRILTASLLLFIGSQGRAAEPIYYSANTTTDQQAQLVAYVENNRERARSHFKNKDYVGLELLVAEGMLSRPMSALGHVALRLLDSDENPLNDTVIAFAMIALDPNEIYSKGLSGGWPNFPTVSDLGSYLSSYALSDLRGSSRLILPSNPEIIAKLKQATLRWQALPQLIDDYKFVKNNCATATLKLLNESGYRVPSVIVEIPTLLPRLLLNSMNTYFNPIQMPDFSVQLQKTVEDFQVRNPQFKRKKIEDTLELPEFWSFLERIPDGEELATLVWLWPYKLNRFRPELTKVMFLRNESLKQFPISRLLPSPAAIYYKLCATTNELCRTERLKALQEQGDLNLLAKRTYDFAARWEQEVRRAQYLVPPAQDAILDAMKAPIIQDMRMLSREIKSLSTRRN